MGALKERVKLNRLVFGQDIVDYYRNNTKFMYEKYSESNIDCESISKEDIQVGRFYLNKQVPGIVCDYRKFSNMIVILGVNFNFIPLELRDSIFDKFITEENFEKNQILEVNFKGMYTELIKYGFEYAIQEYNVAQIKIVHRISLELLPRFLYSSHPKNTYDPKKLLEIWETKLDTKEQRHKEIITSVLKDFYDVKDEISEKYNVLKDHIERLRKSYEKYGKP